MRYWKMQDWKMQLQIAELEFCMFFSGLEIAGGGQY